MIRSACCFYDSGGVAGDGSAECCFGILCVVSLVVFLMIFFLVWFWYVLWI